MRGGMSGTNPYIGEIRLFAGTRAPAGWAFCDGAKLAMSEFPALYSLIGTTYGGDGNTMFALPDLRGRLPVDQGTGDALGHSGGAETVTLNDDQMPPHTHAVMTSPAPSVSSPAGNLPGSLAGGNLLYGTGTAKSSALTLATIAASDGGQAHANIQPYVAINFIIVLQGSYPSE
jgi:microcystin-dependent protein